MNNEDSYIAFFNLVRDSINDGTFAKLTLAKTIGNTPLKNIYIRTYVVNENLYLTLKYRYQTNEEIENHSIEEGFQILKSYINNPFLSIILFTTKSDVILKLNKKRIATIKEESPTFKDADPVLLEYLAK